MKSFIRFSTPKEIGCVSINKKSKIKFNKFLYKNICSQNPKGIKRFVEVAVKEKKGRLQFEFRFIKTPTINAYTLYQQPKKSSGEIQLQKLFNEYSLGKNIQGKYVPSVHSNLVKIIIPKGTERKK